MSNLYVLDTSGELYYTWDWSGQIAEGVALVSVTYDVPTPLEKFYESAPDTVNGQSTIGIRSSTHAGLWNVRAVAALNSGEKVTSSITVRGFNGA